MLSREEEREFRRGEFPPDDGHTCFIVNGEVEHCKKCGDLCECESCRSL